MNDNKFNVQGYLVSKEDNGRQTFLTRQPSSQSSGSAIGQGGSQWTDRPTVNCLFEDQTEARKLAETHSGQVSSVQLSIQVGSPVTA